MEHGRIQLECIEKSPKSGEVTLPEKGYYLRFDFPLAGDTLLRSTAHNP
jgi:hypothetical protein